MTESDFARTLDILGHADGFIALCSKPKDGQFATMVGTPSVIAAAAAVSQDRDTWFTVNEIQGPAGMRGRGGAEAIVRLAALWVDLDVKPGGCPTMEVAEQIITDLSAAIGYDPSVIIHSGHGLQPLWPIEDGEIGDTFTHPEATTLVKRWGRMVATIAATRKAEVDSLYDLPRILRVPGTINHKGEPVPAYATFPPGAPLTIDEIADRLDEFGVPAMESDKLLDEPMNLDDVDWADETCPYVRFMIESWASDHPEARHPWMIAQATRLAAARRNGCITKPDHHDAKQQLERRMHQLCAAEGNTRRVSAAELKDAMAWGEHRISQVHDDHLLAELGAHEHNDVDVEIIEVDQSVIDRAKELAKRGDASFRESAAEHDRLAQQAESEAEAALQREAEYATPEIGELEEIEGEFWTYRQSLATIFDGAMARMASPWAVLGVCMCRALNQVPPWITLPPVVGGKGSLNFFTAIVAQSGGGKGAAENVAAEIVPDDELIIGHVGSGEGLAHHYKRKDRNGWVDITNTVFFSIPEVDALAAQSARQGSTLLTKLREAFSGESLEFGYADVSKRVPVKAHEYRLTLSLGVQPIKAGVVINDAPGGTPQRFVWLPAMDKRISRDKRRAEIDRLWVPQQQAWGIEAAHVEIPAQAVETIESTREAIAQGRGNPLDGHAVFTREKVMVALAALDGRITVTEDDWELSGVVMDVSDWRRRKLVAGLEAEIVRAAEDRGREQGIARAAADDAQEDALTGKALQWMTWKLPELLDEFDKSDRSLTLPELNRRAKSTQRKGAIERAFSVLYQAGEYGYDADTKVITRRDAG